MRRLLIVTILFLLVLGGLWLGGETLLARELRKLAAEDPAIEVAAVSELREFRRIGVHLTDLQIEKPAGSLTLPMLDLWLSPAHLTEARLALPPQAILDTGAGPMTLGLAGTARVARLIRLRTANDLPIAFERTSLPDDILPDPDVVDDSLYLALAARGLRPTRANQRISAVLLNDEEPELLGVPPGSPALSVQRIASFDTGRVMEMSSAHYRSDAYDLVAELTIGP